MKETIHLSQIACEQVLFWKKEKRKGKGEREPVDKHLRLLFHPFVIILPVIYQLGRYLSINFTREQLLGKLTGIERCFAPSENRVKWNTSLIVNFAKRCGSLARELIWCRSFAFQEIRPCWLTVVKTALY